jgi:hypothetical protein
MTSLLDLFRAPAVPAVLAALALASPAAASPSKISRSCEGVLGDHVALGAPAQSRPTIVYFMSKRAGEESAKLAQAVDEQLLDARVEQVGIVDTHRYGGWLRAIAMGRLKKSAGDSRVRRRERRIARGADASPAEVDRWHLVGDFDDALFDLFGVEHEPAHPVAFVVDRSGSVSGPFRDVAAVVSALSSTPDRR